MNNVVYFPISHPNGRGEAELHRGAVSAGHLPCELPDPGPDPKNAATNLRYGIEVWVNEGGAGGELD